MYTLVVLNIKHELENMNDFAIQHDMDTGNRNLTVDPIPQIGSHTTRNFHLSTYIVELITF